jgi:hypothetical protein
MSYPLSKEALQIAFRGCPVFNVGLVSIENAITRDFCPASAAPFLARSPQTVNNLACDHFGGVKCFFERTSLCIVLSAVSGLD